MQSFALLAVFVAGIASGIFLSERQRPSPDTLQASGRQRPSIVQIEDGGADLMQPPCVLPLRCEESHDAAGR
jgi:hypothetical protein